MGSATTFGLKNAEERGTLFISPGAEVYEGMVVGEHQRPGDLDVNVCKTKHLTNMRNQIQDIEVRLTTPREMSLDECIEYLATTSCWKSPRAACASASTFWTARNAASKRNGPRKRWARGSRLRGFPLP